MKMKLCPRCGRRPPWAPFEICTACFYWSLPAGYEMVAARPCLDCGRHMPPGRAALCAGCFVGRGRAAGSTKRARARRGLRLERKKG